jgi:hypothetical protein
MRDPSALYQDDPHPVSGHRTPRDIAEDEVGAIGGTRNDPPKNLRADNGPVRPLDVELRGSPYAALSLRYSAHPVPLP